MDGPLVSSYLPSQELHILNYSIYKAFFSVDFTILLCFLHRHFNSGKRIDKRSKNNQLGKIRWSIIVVPKLIKDNYKNQDGSSVLKVTQTLTKIEYSNN